MRWIYKGQLKVDVKFCVQIFVNPVGFINFVNNTRRGIDLICGSYFARKFQIFGVYNIGFACLGLHAFFVSVKIELGAVMGAVMGAIMDTVVVYEKAVRTG